MNKGTKLERELERVCARLRALNEKRVYSVSDEKIKSLKVEKLSNKIDELETLIEKLENK